jgi:hypothetical protein
VCHLLGIIPRLQLQVFRSTGSYKQDRKQLGGNTAILLSPHGGAMANMLFMPPNTSVIEFVDLSTGNPYYIGLSRVLGFTHLTVKPKVFDHYNDSIPLVVDFDEVLDALRQVEPIQSYIRRGVLKNRTHVDTCMRIVDKEFI